MRNIILIYLAFLVISINGLDFKLTIDQVNNQTVKLVQNQKCEQSFCFVGDAVLTVQSDSQRITSLTLQDSTQKLVLPVCPSSKVLTFNAGENILQLFNSQDNTCYPYSNTFYSSQVKPISYGFRLNALLADQKTYQQFYVQGNLSDKSGTSSSIQVFYVQVSMLILALILLI